MSEEPVGKPYLVPGRLPNVIAAIQAMGTTAWGSVPIDSWVYQIEGAEQMAMGEYRQDKVKEKDRKKWLEIFAQHPEFFKLYKLEDDDRVALRWRFAQPIDYDPKSGKILSANKLQGIKRNVAFYRRYSRKPLTPDQINVLIKTAIELHTRVIAEQQDRRWHWPIVSTAATAVVTAVFGMIGVIVGAYLKSGSP